MQRFESIATVCRGSDLKCSLKISSGGIDKDLKGSIKQKVACYERGQREAADQTVHKQNRHKVMKSKALQQLKGNQIANRQEKRQEQKVDILTESDTNLREKNHLKVEQMRQMGYQPPNQKADPYCSLKHVNSQANDSQANDSQANDSQATNSQANDSQAAKSQANDSQATNSQANDSQAAKSQANDSQAVNSHANDSQANDSQATNSQANESQANDSQANDSQATNSQANDSQAGNSQANDSQATNSHANDSQANDSQATNSQANESQANDSQANDSQATNSQANDSQAGNSQANDSQANDSQATNSQANDSQGANSQANDSQANDSQATNSQATNSQAANSQANDSQANDSQASDSQVTNSQANDSQGVNGQANSNDVKDGRSGGECGQIRTIANETQYVTNRLKYGRQEMLCLISVSEWAPPEPCRLSALSEPLLNRHVAAIVTCALWSTCVDSSPKQYLRETKPETSETKPNVKKNSPSAALPYSHCESAAAELLNLEAESSTRPKVQGLSPETGPDSMEIRAVEDPNHSRAEDIPKLLHKHVIPRVHRLHCHQQGPDRSNSYSQSAPDKETMSPPSQSDTSTTAPNNALMRKEKFEDIAISHNNHSIKKMKPEEAKPLERDKKAAAAEEEVTLVDITDNKMQQRLSEDTANEDEDIKTIDVTLPEIKPERYETIQRPKYTTINYGDPSVKQTYKPKIIRFTDTFTF